MRVKRLTYIESLPTYQALSWSGELSADHLRYLDERVFQDQKKVVLVTVEAKNLNARVMDLGQASPSWRLRCSDGQTLTSGLHNQVVAMRMLTGGMPLSSKLAPGKSAEGTLVFFVPDQTTARALYFESVRHSRDGETQSLVLKLDEGSAPTKSVPVGQITDFPLVQDPTKPGGWKAPLTQAGPAGSWVSNGAWMMRLLRVNRIDTMAEYEALPWTDRLGPKERDSHFAYMTKYVFIQGAKRQRVLLVTLEAKNLTGKKIHFGMTQPNWKLECSDGKIEASSVHNETLANWCIKGGMPQDALLDRDAKTQATLVFFLPVEAEPRALFFETMKHSQHGESKSLILSL